MTGRLAPHDELCRILNEILRGRKRLRIRSLGLGLKRSREYSAEGSATDSGALGVVKNLLDKRRVDPVKKAMLTLRLYQKEVSRDGKQPSSDVKLASHGQLLDALVMFMATMVADSLIICHLT